MFVKHVNKSVDIGSIVLVLTAAACKNFNCQNDDAIHTNGDKHSGVIVTFDNFGCDAAGNRSKGSLLEGHSHSVVPGGLDVRSYMTREMPGTVKIPSTIF